MSAELLQIITTTSMDSRLIATRTGQIHAAVLAKSKYLNEPNFGRIHTADLALLFAEYDVAFFQGQLKPALGASPLSFGLSRRMTSSGGKTLRVTSRATCRKCRAFAVFGPRRTGTSGKCSISPA